MRLKKSSGRDFLQKVPIYWRLPPVAPTIEIASLRSQ